MQPVLTPAEAADLDRRSAERGIAVSDLMERAGWAVADAVRTLLGGTYGRRVVVLCGGGNNGGDGLVAARLLDRWGAGVTAVLMAVPPAPRGAGGTAFERFDRADGRWIRFDPDRLADALARADAAVDAVFGTGFHGGPQGAFEAALSTLAGSGVPTVAVDVPSGVDGGTGAVPGMAVRAVTTVTFGARKPGVVFHPGAAYAGRIRVADIGFPRDLVWSELWLMEHRDAAALVPRRSASGHKRSSGVVLVVAGSRDMTGAPVLAASAAYRAGAGLVTLAVPESARAAAQSSLIEATFEPLPETEDGGVAEAAWPQLEKRLAEVDAVAVGPGLGRSAETMEVVRRIVASSPAPVVLDADGLFAFAGQLSRLAERRAGLIVTPHAGEFGRLLGTSAKDATEDRVERARRAAAEAGCAVLLKGAPTLVAEQGGRVRINATGGSALSTAGTGDVLTGAVAAFLARGLTPEDAGALGAYVHGLAGDLAALRTGEGTTASDVAVALPQAVGRLSHPASAGGP